MSRQPNGTRRTTVRLSPDVLEPLTLMARERGCPRSVLISTLLRECVADDAHRAKLREQRR